MSSTVAARMRRPVSGSFVRAMADASVSVTRSYVTPPWQHLVHNDTLSVRFEWGKDLSMALIERPVVAPPDAPHVAEAAPPDPRRWFTLAILCTSLMIVIVGNT